MINEDLPFNQCANRLDRSRNYMNVIVVEGQSSNDESVKLKKSNYVICPQCKENAFLSIRDFKLSITGCKSKHKTEDLELKEFENTQFIDQSKISCDICNNLKNDNQFFECLKCQQNLCLSCYGEHDKSHNECIKNYEETQFYCKLHFKEYEFYCTDCKKDLCTLCKEEHKEHEYISYDNILPDYNNIKERELKDAKEKIYQLKTIVNGMIYQLNHLNKNLDNYFELYYNIVSNYDIKKRNYCLIQNINNTKIYTNNFLLNITEIIKNDNLKLQFTNIISLQTKLDFKRLKKNKQIKEQANKNEIMINNPGSENNEINNHLVDKYENFNINKMKEIQSFTINNEIEKLLVLNDGRILTNQRYFDETGKYYYKLCVYSIKNGFVCDINIDFGKIYEFYQMDDGNIVTYNHEVGQIQIIKIHKNNISQESNFDKELSSIKKLSKNKILISRSHNIPNNILLRNRDQYISLIHDEELYSYDKGKLIFYKNIKKILGDELVENICQINENEYVFYASKIDTLDKVENNLIIFYNIINDKIIKKLNVGKGENKYEMALLNKDNLIISGKDSTILIDIKNRQIGKEFKANMYFIDIGSIICLNDNNFLSRFFIYLNQYDLANFETINLKERKEIPITFISKYPKNKIITYYDKTISIFG